MTNCQTRRGGHQHPWMESLEPRLYLHGDVPHDEPHDDHGSAIEVASHAVTDHIHSLLAIFIHGDRVDIPTSVGVLPNGTIISFTHTHDASGIIHIHPVNGVNPPALQTVGDFFDTWAFTAGAAGNNPDAVFNQNEILGFVANEQFVVRMYVNEVLNDAYENYVMQDGDVIIISYEPAALIRLTDAGDKSVTFTDADGTTATLAIKGGQADVSFAGEDVSVLRDGKKLFVNGQDLRITIVELTNTTAKTNLTVKAKGGDGVIIVPDLSADGPMNAIAAKQVNFTGTIDIDGPLKKLDAGAFAQAQITIGASANPRDALALSFVTAVDTGLNSGIGVKSVKGQSWTDVNGDAEAIAAPWVGAYAVMGVSGVDMVLSGANAPKGVVLKSAKVGTIAGGDWTGVGDAGAIAATDILAGWSATFTGIIKAIKAGNNAAGAIQAAAIQSFQVKNNLTDATITLTMPFDPADTKAKNVAMKSLKVGGTAQDLSLRSNTHLGTIQGGKFLDVTIFAGVMDVVPDASMPDPGDFANAAQINGVTVKGIKGDAVGMRNAHFAAAAMGKVKAVNATGNDSPSAFTASSFGGFQYAGANGKQKLDKLALVTEGETTFDESLLVRVV